jgi:hypothetical protein
MQIILLSPGFLDDFFVECVADKNVDREISISIFVILIAITCAWIFLWWWYGVHIPIHFDQVCLSGLAVPDLE